MDPKQSGDVVKHLEKQNELLMDAYRSMSHELHKLQVEEEMLMRKYYEFMAAQDLVGKVRFLHPFRMHYHLLLYLHILSLSLGLDVLALCISIGFTVRSGTQVV